MKKYHKIIFNCMAVIITLLLTATTVLAADKEYKLKDIDLTVTAPDDLIVFTRETTASNPNYDYIDKEALELTADMEQKNMYLYAIDKDSTYDITIIATRAPSSLEYYNNCTDEEIDTIMATNRRDLEAIPNLTVNSIDVYEQSDTKMIRYDVVNASESDGLNKVYIIEYDTVFQDFEYTIKLQSYGKEISDDTLRMFDYMVKNMSFSELSGSSVRTRIVNEALELFIGAAMFIAFLGIILFILNMSKKNKKKHVL